MQDAGLQAISDLEGSLRNFSKRLEAGDGDRVKQEVPDLQQDALTYVGRIEEAMVQGFPFEVPKKFANLPQLKVSILKAKLAWPNVPLTGRKVKNGDTGLCLCPGSQLLCTI